MEKKTFVVTGEASESDTEEEINYPFVKGSGPNTPKLSVSTTQKGKVIIGEAPESDEEQEQEISILNVPRATKILSTDKILYSSNFGSTKNLPKHEAGLQFKTLLHKKLRERNVSLFKNVNELIHHNVWNAGRELNTANQQLVHSQVQLQEAVSALNTLHANTAILKTKIAAITSASFLPNIIIPQ